MRPAAQMPAIYRVRQTHPHKDRLVQIDIPSLNSAEDPVKASAAIVAALSAGELTPSEASELGKLVASYVAALTATDFEKRLAQLETAAAGT